MKANVTTNAKIINKTASATNVKSKSNNPPALSKNEFEKIINLYLFSINKVLIRFGNSKPY